MTVRTSPPVLVVSLEKVGRTRWSAASAPSLSSQRGLLVEHLPAKAREICRANAKTCHQGKAIGTIGVDAGQTVLLQFVNR